MLGQPYFKFTAIAVLGLALTGCIETSGNKDSMSQDAPRSTKTIEQDVEAPEVFQVNEEGLWDGRPSLGGVWVAHPTAKDPERVLIRNEANGKFVIGALFRKERDTPGPKLQVSSDAAEAIGLIAGAPVKMNVTALRREEIVLEPAPTPEPAPVEMAAEAPSKTAKPTKASKAQKPSTKTSKTAKKGDAATSEVKETALDPIASAAAALDAVESGATAKAATTKMAPAKAAATAAVAAAKPKTAAKQTFLQLGIFSVEANAQATADKMRSAGVIPTIKKQTSKGKTFWRVIIGPISGSGEKASLLKTVNGLGYSDAYFVSN